jgi:hypothetical protein
MSPYKRDGLLDPFEHIKEIDDGNTTDRKDARIRGR